MYLKALEIQGFKSFPDKTRITFEKDITAIVGPNGSGKSNISDAILWVMGEQRSKTLRGGKMEDVIFGGTEKRSPLGFAQVTLIIDNSEHIFDCDNTELMLTRRYYRSGESEYYINREAVRLKDINNILMDTGLGRDGYSIIGQGRISEIVSSRASDRREIFEEAAGISRYRSRKEESERKLAKTEENLVRINDKIDELELQVEPLNKQSETAKKYLVLRDELRLREISVWMATLDKLKIQNEVVEKDYESLDGTRTQYNYEESSNGNFSSNYKITDIDNNVLLDESRTFVILSDRHFVSTCNDKTWHMEIDLDNKLTVTNDAGETVTFDLDEFTKNNMNNTDILSILSRLPGQEYFYMARAGITNIAPDNIYNNAHYSPDTKDIHLGLWERTIATTLHEEGHGKDWNITKISTNPSITEQTFNALRFDTNLVAIYNEECANFIKAFPKLEKDFTIYFTNVPLMNDRANQGLAEVIAETNMLLNQVTGKYHQRSEILRRYFPKTIAYVTKKLNPDVYNNQ